MCGGSSAAGLKAALKAVGVNYGDEVVTQAFNFVATIEIIDCGAKPVICGVDENLHGFRRFAKKDK